MKKTLIALTSVSLLTISGCSSAPTATELAEDQIKAEQVIADAKQEKAEKQLSNIPDWVLNPPQNDVTGVYGIGIAESSKLNIAIKKATLNAQFELAKAFNQEMSGNEKSFIQESNSGVTEQYTQLIDTIVDNVPMGGYVTVRQEAVTNDGKFTVYKLMKLTYEQAQKAAQKASMQSTDDKIKNAFRELEERLDSRKKA
ncbi:hypothetical protein BIT28_24615 [Photobacterium proteolyticum]|uniref:LPP20 lipoprotein n=1 Tax=Photobacterium proteolyticum TaxID=1903952 RepID=A0A1Q9GCW7_9GAMM|nr:LPP20 family lipoprotein [Photobacterium proteolyticum]OLQ72206.1 hypothetical protein BIT28_24615 [Photobacterium proteolyticum]